MRKLFFWSLLTFIISTCKYDASGKYKYVEIYESGNKKDTVVLKADNDTAAYMESFMRYTSVVAVYNDFEDKRYLDAPSDFAVINPHGYNIRSTVDFVTKDKFEREILESETFVKNKKPSVSKSLPLDSALIEELKSKFNVTKEEFTNNDELWYIPKTAPKYINTNGVYCYFQTINGRAKNPRFKLQFVHDEWVFMKKVIFLIDGKAYDYYPDEPMADNGNGKRWEWFDNSIQYTLAEIINAITLESNVKIKVEGDRNYKIITLTNSQIHLIEETVRLFNAKGGVL